MNKKRETIRKPLEHEIHSDWDDQDFDEASGELESEDSEEDEIFSDEDDG